MTIKHHVDSLLIAMKYPLVYTAFDELHLLAYEVHLALQEPIPPITPFVAYLEEVYLYVRGAGLLRLLYRTYDSPFDLDMTLIDDYFKSLHELDRHIALIEADLLSALYHQHPLNSEMASFLKPDESIHGYQMDRTRFTKMMDKPVDCLLHELEQVYAFRKPWMRDVPRIEQLVEKIKFYHF